MSLVNDMVSAFNREISERLENEPEITGGALPTEITIKPNILDISNINEGNGSKDYRPTSWNEYVGQDKAKKRVQSYIKGCKEFDDIFPHTFLSAPAGHGKTLFANILANQLGKKLVIVTGGELKNEQLFIDKLAECDGGIFFIDEANLIPKKVGFFMLPILEQFEVQGKKLKSFTCILATTHKGDLSKDLDALIQRCISIDLEEYSNEQLENIITQYQKKQYPKVNVAKEIVAKIVLNSRQTPRIARALLKEYIYTLDLNEALINNQIVKDGLTQTDIKTMMYLSRFNGVGKNSIAKFLRVKPQTFEHEIEPYLIHKEFVEIGARRKITEKGKEFLKCLK